MARNAVGNKVKVTINEIYWYHSILLSLLFNSIMQSVNMINMLHEVFRMQFSIDRWAREESSPSPVNSAPQGGGITMNRIAGIDHITLCVENLDATEFLFTKVLGFEVIWSARGVGSDKSSMDTVVVQRGEARVALMRGRDKTMKSQINEFIEKYGQGVQHFALEVDDIDAVCREWEALGVQFSGPVKEGRDGFGPLKQRFTYPLFPVSGLFIELIQREHGGEKAKTFVRSTVESLYQDIEREQASGLSRTIIDYNASLPASLAPMEKKPLKRAS